MAHKENEGDGSAVGLQALGMKIQHNRSVLASFKSHDNGEG